MQKEKEKKTQEESPSFFKELGVYMKAYQSLYAVSVLISILAVAMNVASYAFAGLIISMLFGSIDNRLYLYVGLCILTRILYAIFINISTWMSHKAAYRTLKDVRTAMSEKMLRLPLGYFELNGSGRLKTLITDQVEAMEKPLAHVLPELTANLLVPLVLIVWLFFIDWRLALAALIWMFVGFGVTSGMMKNYPEKFAGQIKCDKEKNQTITEYVGGIEVIKNFGQTENSCQKYQKSVFDYANYNINWQRETQVYTALGMAIAPFSIFPVLFLGIILFVNNSLEPATLFLAALLTMGIFGPLMQSSSYFDQLAQMGTVAKELRGILDYQELVRGEEVKANDATVEFKHVSFSYEASDHKALDDISFKVNSGEMLALVGPSGSGKSTIAKLIAGYWDAKEGEILIGGKPLNSYTQEALNNLIAFVDQDTFLFDKSIEDNIRIARPNASSEEVIEVAKSAGIHDFIMKLENGYQTMAGSAGSMLSGGEKQRIAIARAMMKNAPIMILDEATASADPENESLIQDALSKASKGKTLIVVAHHLSTIVNAEQIAYIKDGQLAKIGKHEELINNFKDYKSLWDLSKEG